jgi:hypothetical protein
VRCVGAACAALLLPACASFGGVRPREVPVAGAVQLVVEPRAMALVQSLDSVVRARGMTVRALAPAEGYLETDWYDLGSQSSTRPPFRDLGRIVKLRILVDPVQGKTRVIAECVMRIAWDPSVPERDLERMVPEDHPGRSLLNEILRAAGAVPIAPQATPAPSSQPQP